MPRLLDLYRLISIRLMGVRNPTDEQLRDLAREVGNEMGGMHLNDAELRERARVS